MSTRNINSSYRRAAESFYHDSRKWKVRLLLEYDTGGWENSLMSWSDKQLPFECELVFPCTEKARIMAFGLFREGESEPFFKSHFQNGKGGISVSEGDTFQMNFKDVKYPFEGHDYPIEDLMAVLPTQRRTIDDEWQSSWIESDSES